MEKLIITAAICGAEVTKEQNPAVPYTVAEIAREARLSYEAGAAVIHLHVRGMTVRPPSVRNVLKNALPLSRRNVPM